MDISIWWKGKTNPIERKDDLVYVKKRGQYGKNKRGNEFKKIVEAILKSLPEIRKIKSRSFSYPDHNQKFGFDYDIELSNEEHWLIQCQTSLGDITQKHEWRAMNIQKIIENDKSFVDRISRYYVVFEDNAGHGSISMSNRHKAGEIKSVIDGYLPVHDMVETIQEYSYIIEEKEQGAKNALRGLKKEQYVKQILESEANFRKYFNEENIPGLEFHLYAKILGKLGIKSDDKVVSIKASDDKKVIGRLKGANGRSAPPKTDVVILIEYEGGIRIGKTLSLKNSSGKRKDITVFQTSAKHICSSLGFTNKKLIAAFEHFQECGSKEKLDEKYPDDAKELTNKLKPYMDVFEKCLFSGRGIPCVGDEKYQYADYILLLGKNNSVIYSIDEYIKALHDMDVDRMFGTVFSWTYQGTRGKSIQWNTSSLIARAEHMESK